MAKRYFTKKQVLKAIACPHLDLVDNGDGYLYFVYDNGPVYMTESVYVNHLNQMEKDRWVVIGKVFASRMDGVVLSYRGK